MKVMGTCNLGVDGAGLVPWVGGPLDASSAFLPKRSIPKPDQHRKDIIEQKSLCTDMLSELKNSNCTR